MTDQGKIPRFFKIILQSTLLHQKLMVPVKFARNHGECLQKHALLKIPSGETWKVELRKYDGKVWLEKGWKEFADHYSLAHGQFLVFEYRGNSVFYVLIFDNTATEIDYPLISSRRIDHELPPQGVEDSDSEDDESVEILHECSFFKKKRERSPLPSPRPQKITKTDSTPETSEGKRGVGRMHHLTNSEKAIAVKRASSFQSKNPFCKVVMQPNFVGKDFRLTIPIGFARKYFPQKEGKITFNGPRERTWSSNYCVNDQARICCGWRKFALDNYLEVGDVCVFELIHSKEILLNVVIFRSTGKNLRNHQSQGGISQSKIRKSSAGEFDKGSSSSSVTGAATTKLVAPYPFFNVVLLKSPLDSSNVSIPKIYLEKYVKHKKQDMLLKVGDSSWPVRLNYYPAHGSGILSAGWNVFARGNSLKVGDVCTFELVKSNVLRVSISRKERAC